MTAVMDNADLYAGLTPPFKGAFLPSSLWGGPHGLPRSKPFSPLYVERFKGARLSGSSSSHGFWELSVVLDGAMELLAPDAQSFHMEKGSAVLIPPGAAHEERASKPVDSVWIGFSKGLGPSEAAAPLAACSPELSQAAERLWLLAQLRKPLSGSELDGQLLSLYGLFARLLDSGATGESGLLADKAMRLLNERYADSSVSISGLASELGVSEGHFFRAFKERFGMTPLERLTELRLKQACQLLLNSGMNLASIAKECGYQDQFYFSRVFKKLHGESPSAWRAKALSPLRP